MLQQMTGPSREVREAACGLDTWWTQIDAGNLPGRELKMPKTDSPATPYDFDPDILSG